MWPWSLWIWLESGNWVKKPCLSIVMISVQVSGSHTRSLPLTKHKGRKGTLRLCFSFIPWESVINQLFSKFLPRWNNVPLHPTAHDGEYAYLVLDDWVLDFFFSLEYIWFGASQVAHEKRICLSMLGSQKTWIWSLGWKDLLEKEMVTQSSLLAWEIPWTEKPGGLQRVGHDLETEYACTHSFFTMLS